ncbi:MAG: hypothetical protein M3P27_08925 [Acidobacteriota bacterium]|nr:hypothetical protein [Acidobacteriota bacterium]
MIRENLARILGSALLLGVLGTAPAFAQTSPPYTPKSADDHALSQSEANSIAYMKTLYYNEREYKKKMGRYSGSLLALTGGGRSFTKRMARPDRGDYAVGYRGGKDGFSVTLTPKQFDPTRRGFYMDTSGVIRVQEGAPATSESEALK